jgi:hypothetical protein
MFTSHNNYPLAWQQFIDSVRSYQCHTDFLMTVETCTYTIPLLYFYILYSFYLISMALGFSILVGTFKCCDT